MIWQSKVGLYNEPITCEADTDDLTRGKLRGVYYTPLNLPLDGRSRSRGGSDGDVRECSTPFKLGV